MFFLGWLSFIDSFFISGFYCVFFLFYLRFSCFLLLRNDPLTTLQLYSIQLLSNVFKKPTKRIPHLSLCLFYSLTFSQKLFFSHPLTAGLLFLNDLRKVSQDLDFQTFAYNFSTFEFIDVGKNRGTFSGSLLRFFV